ncbi:phosphopantetheine adenylyltransferase [Coxiella endosymbiont of Amblyomma americanum]|nr:pantetheine-phosphate adenylyltransferase [Coxiella endosymbiont of Amblyomma americanum]AJC50455.1 phosphopantetheine adenylyltransferase [Coxiella endosymbiont of Amblyomma americanum]AUJ58794.1 pantetheine-phosphate adenylyltransferase [Coxiella-like endosymbiont of Amblyomma americanum]
MVVYPGTFDPLTQGHIDIVRRALFLFENITIACYASPIIGDRTSYLSLSERVRLIKEVFSDSPNIKVVSFKGLLVDFVKQNNTPIILRGLRSVADFDYELQLAYMNYRLSPEIETVFLSAREGYNYISGTLVREIMELGGDISSFVPVPISEWLKKRKK